MWELQKGQEGICVAMRSNCAGVPLVLSDGEAVEKRVFDFSFLLSSDICLCTHVCVGKLEENCEEGNRYIKCGRIDG